VVETLNPELASFAAVSTLPLNRSRAGLRELGALGRGSISFPSALAAALLLLILYAAFSHAAAALAPAARIEVAVAVISVVAAGAWLWTGALRLSAGRAAVAGTALLALFAVWTGVTVLWSVAPNQTWIELNRAVMYVLVLGLSIAVGSSLSAAAELAASGFVLVALAVTYYALGQKVLPGLHVPGVFDLNQTAQIPRLQEPFGYWNALALFVSFGVPMALAMTVDVRRSLRARTGALVSAQLMLVTVGLTYSRGGLIALVVGLAVWVALSGARLRALMWLASATVAAIPPLVFGLTANALNKPRVSLGSREAAGLILLLILAVSAVALFRAARVLQTREESVRITPERARRIARLLLSLTGLAAVIGVLAITLSGRGFTGTFSHVWRSFTATHAASTYDPARLLSANSENRWIWWKEAAGAFSDRPIAGWGAGSFGVVHLLYRRDRLTVDQPHSVPLQFLSDTGLIGAALAIAAFALLLVVAVRRVRAEPPGHRRLISGALLGAAVMFTVHSLYDWDWDIPALAMPAFLFLGVLAGTPGPRRTDHRGLGARAVALAALALAACTFAVSAALPSIAASKATHAVVEAAGSPSARQHALQTAMLASRLDPLSDAGLLVESLIAQHDRQFDRARSMLLAAISRNPSDPAAWQQLAVLEYTLGDTRDSRRAAARLAQLDPMSAANARGAASAAVRLTPPQDSATAQPLAGR
jgi:tetratricopeptide (TPR) repeat protein